MNLGGSCTLECQAPGKPLPELKWLKNGKEIKPTEHLLLESQPDGTHRLTLDNVQPDHAGQYVANVKHKLRTQQMIFNVTVIGIRRVTVHELVQLPVFASFAVIFLYSIRLSLLLVCLTNKIDRPSEKQLA